MQKRISTSTVMNDKATTDENQNMNADSFCSLKRKRPPKIEIPSLLCEIRVNSEPCFKNDCFSGHGVGLFCRKGKKTIMEDTYKIISTSNGKRGFFGVYDGHGGRKAAEFVAENLHSYVFEMLDNGSSATREKAIEAAYLKTDQRFLKQGGYVELHRGGWRVHGVLSVSRSIGDAHLKDWVPAEPDTKTLILAPDMEYLVLASDGLWDEVGNQEAVDIIMQYCPREKSMQLPVSTLNEKGKEFYCLSKSPSKLGRVPIIKSNRRKSHSPCCKKTVNSWMASEDEFGNENESPPKKARRVSTMNQTKMKMKIHSPNQENSGLNKNQPSNALVAACRELVNLAVSRGSSDDITVMIIDLSHFKC